jgi:hypothetical protein
MQPMIGGIMGYTHNTDTNKDNKNLLKVDLKVIYIYKKNKHFSKICTHRPSLLLIKLDKS